MAAATQIPTGKVRFSYNNLFTPRAAQEGAQEKYSTTLLIPKSDKATVKKIKAAMEAADYSEGSEMDLLVKTVIDKIALDYKLERMEAIRS